MPKDVSFQDRFRAVGYACISRRKRGDGVSLSDEIKTDDTGRVTDEVLLQFIDLVTRCLELDPDKRLTPSRALRHRFWTAGFPPAGKQQAATPEPTMSSPQPANSTAAAADNYDESVPEANREDNLSSQHSQTVCYYLTTFTINIWLSCSVLCQGSGVTGMQQAMAKATLSSDQTNC